MRPSDKIDLLCAELQRSYVKWHYMNKAGAAPENLNEERLHFLKTKELLKDLLHSTQTVPPSAFYTPEPKFKEDNETLSKQ